MITTNKVYLYDVEITDKELARRLQRNILNYFTEVTEGRYTCNGYEHPLLTHITNTHAHIYDPFKYSGSYNYNGQQQITLHSTYGRLNHYRLLNIYNLYFYVDTTLSDEDAVLAAMTDSTFINTLIKALA